MKQLLNFFKNYYLFSVAALALIAAIILQILKHKLAVKWLLGSVAIIEVLPLVWGMWQDLREGTYGIDILAATAIVSSVAFKQFWAAIVIVIMLTGGEALEDYAEHRAKTEVDALLKSKPEMAHLLKNNKEVDVKISEVQTGNKIIIRPGEIVPVDAVIIEGTASFDESSITGESLPQTKGVNDEILSGTINQDGVITAKALRPASESQFEQIIKLVQSASKTQSPFVRLADRYSIPFTVVSFGIAIAAWLVSGHPIRFLEVLVVATPCPLILAAPIAIISGMSRAAKNGIIIKTGSALEKLAEAKTIAFDKTGTLTEGRPEVKEVQGFNGYKVSEVLSVASGVEQGSNHILAQAIITATNKRKVRPQKAKQVTEISGLGLKAMVNRQHVIVGRLQLLNENDVNLPKDLNPKKIQATATYVAINGKLAGLITFEDAIRPESKRTIKHLRENGFEHILMITGDNASNAQAVAKKFGIKEVIADALPADKLHALDAVTDRPVVFTGDGVNDAPVLTASDVGIALGARGQTAASESADMVILLDDLERVAVAREIAQDTFAIGKQSILVGIAISVGLMFIFATGKFAPVYGAAIQELVDVIVIFNALRAHGPFKQLAQAKTTNAVLEAQ